MKILHISRDYSNSGGAEQYLFDLCSALENLGHEVAVIYGHKNEKTWHVPGRNEYFLHGVHEFSNGANDKILKACNDIIERENPDIINLHITSNPRLVYQLRKARPLIKSVHTPYFCCLRYKLFRMTDTVCTRPLGCYCLLAAYLKRCADPRPWNLAKDWQRCNHELENYRRLDQIVVFSKYVKDCLLQNEFEGDQVAVLSYFTNPPARVTQDNQAHENLILCVGRVTQEKGLDYLLRAVKEVSLDCRLVVVGDGWYLNKTKYLARQLGMAHRVEFPGWVPHKDLGDYYSKCSMLVVPSVWPEPFGIVGIEAMGYAKPVVAFNVGGISEWLDHGETGFLIEPKNVKEMAAKIALLLKDREHAAKMGKKGREKVLRDFNKQRHVESLMRVYQQLVEKARAPMLVH